jgi:MoxR-like ATPase
VTVRSGAAGDTLQAVIPPLQRLDALRQNVRKVYLGPARGLDLALTALLAGGHVLLDDVPGVGKTTLARALARSLALGCQRVQFTSDLLPGDVTGSSVFDPRSGSFSFRQGPVFTQILIADEINRASPRTQSALLECMEERAVTVDGVRHALPELFWVMATQNPVETQGTFLLPRSQLDRFLVRLSLGYPDEQAELAILEKDRGGLSPEQLEPVLAPADLAQLQAQVQRLHAAPEVRAYIVAVTRTTREGPRFSLGAGPRASIALLRAASAWALLAGREFVSVDDVKAVAHPVLAHRLVEADGEVSPARPETLAEVLASVPSPV